MLKNNCFVKFLKINYIKFSDVLVHCMQGRDRAADKRDETVQIKKDKELSRRDVFFFFLSIFLLFFGAEWKMNAA